MWFRFHYSAPLRELIERGDGVIGIVGDLPVTECGVSGYDENDCIFIVRNEVFGGGPLPELRDRVADVDVSTLPEHVRTHLGNPARRGVWFPPMNLDRSASA